MNELTRTLLSMCEYLASVQSSDGGFQCEACEFEHGRADNAVFPFVTAYSLTNSHEWLERTEMLLEFRRKLENEDGSVGNDFQSGWKGITAFSAIGLYKALIFYGKIITPKLYDEIEKCFKKSARWVHENIKPGFRANINYYCASAAVNAMYGRMYSDNEYTERANELLAYCMGMFCENGIIRGEGQPHGFVTPHGCVSADIGYIVEESIPCLTDAALALKNVKALKMLAGYSVKLLEFMLPDGAWDNTFGSRNNKWTYYGSRTSSGCTGAFLSLSAYRPELSEAAFRNLKLICRCSYNGALYGGYGYYEFGQKPCVHHTFGHALGIADAIAVGADIKGKSLFLPCDCTENRIAFFKEINTYRIYYGKWIATFTCNDFSTYTWDNGASHASGGTLSMLYHRERGPVIAGSVYEYKRTETNNMQLPAGNVLHRSLLPRIDAESNGKKYSTALCFESSIEIEKNPDSSLAVKVRTRPETTEHEYFPDSGFMEIEYLFKENEICINAGSNSFFSDSFFVLPIISDSGVEIKGKYVKKEKIFFLTPGFGADEYKFKADKGCRCIISGE